MEAPDIRSIEEREANPSEPAMQYRIDIFEAWCKSCGICVAFCPSGCLEPSDERLPRVARPDLCSGCGWCEIHCPDFAIRLRPGSPTRLRPDEEAE